MKFRFWFLGLATEAGIGGGGMGVGFLAARVTSSYWESLGPLLGFLVLLMKDFKNRLKKETRGQFY